MKRTFLKSLGVSVFLTSVACLNAAELISNLDELWNQPGIGEIRSPEPGVSYATAFTTGPDSPILEAVTLEELAGPLNHSSAFHVRLCQPAFDPFLGAMTMSVVAELGSPTLDPAPTQWPGSTLRVAYRPAAPMQLLPNTQYAVVVSEASSGFIEASVLFTPSAGFQAEPGWQMGADYMAFDFGGFEFWLDSLLPGHLKFSLRSPAPITPNSPPDVAAALPSVEVLWSPDGTMVPFEILGVTDPDGDSVAISILSIQQDEPVLGNTDPTAPDAVIDGDGGWVRAERLGRGNGRVYKIVFEANDGHPDGVAQGTVWIRVPHDQGSGAGAIDDGPVSGYYDSTVVKAALKSVRNR